MSQMHNPPHPGETLREDVLPALGLSVTDAAAQLGARCALARAQRAGRDFARDGAAAAALAGRRARRQRQRLAEHANGIRPVADPEEREARAQQDQARQARGADGLNLKSGASAVLRQIGRAKCLRHEARTDHNMQP